MKIKQKLLCGFLAVSLLTLGVSYTVGLVVQQETLESFQEVGGEMMPGNLALARMTSELYHAYLLVLELEDKQDVVTREVQTTTFRVADRYLDRNDSFQRHIGLAQQVVVVDELVAAGDQQVRGRLLDTYADHSFVVFFELVDQRRKVAVTREQRKGVDVVF